MLYSLFYFCSFKTNLVVCTFDVVLVGSHIFGCVCSNILTYA